MPASQTTLLIKCGIDESGLEPAMWRLHGTLWGSHSLPASLWWWEMNTACCGSIVAHWLTISPHLVLSSARLPSVLVSFWLSKWCDSLVAVCQRSCSTSLPSSKCQSGSQATMPWLIMCRTHWVSDWFSYSVKKLFVILSKTVKHF